MRGFSLVAVCSYSVNKYHRECIKTHRFDVRNTKEILKRGHSPIPRPHPLGAFGARPPVPLSDGLDTRPCEIPDPRLVIQLCESKQFCKQWTEESGEPQKQAGSRRGSRRAMLCTYVPSTSSEKNCSVYQLSIHSSRARTLAVSSRKSFN